MFDYSLEETFMTKVIQQVIKGLWLPKKRAKQLAKYCLVSLAGIVGGKDTTIYILDILDRVYV